MNTVRVIIEKIEVPSTAQRISLILFGLVELIISVIPCFINLWYHSITTIAKVNTFLHFFTLFLIFFHTFLRINKTKKGIDMSELVQLKASEVATFRDQILEEQNGCCAWCEQPITEETGISLDHQHKRKADPCGPDGAGLIRGVLCRSCNVLEGKIWNNMARYKQPQNVKERIELLLSLVDYYGKGTYNVIHPSEKAKEPTVSKRNYNRLKKVYDGKKKFPEYPKSGKLTVGLQALFEQYGIEPYN